MGTVTNTLTRTRTPTFTTTTSSTTRTATQTVTTTTHTRTTTSTTPTHAPTTKRQSTTSSPFNCWAGLKFQNGWSKSKRNWCCHSLKIGCAGTLAQDYNCHDGQQSRWSRRQSMACCVRENIGCWTPSRSLLDRKAEGWAFQLAQQLVL